MSNHNMFAQRNKYYVDIPSYVQLCIPENFATTFQWETAFTDWNLVPWNQNPFKSWDYS